MASDPERIAIEVYRVMVALEQKKAGIYANLWTILFTGIASLFGVYLAKPVDNAAILFLIPPLIFIWATFATFNYFYLSALRSYISSLESILAPGVAHKFWFKDFFGPVVSKIAMKFLNTFIPILLPILALLPLAILFFRHSDIYPRYSTIIYGLVALVLFSVLAILILLSKIKLENRVKELLGISKAS